MWYIIICVVSLIVLVILYTKFTKAGKTPIEEINEVATDCCGAHEVCELDLRKLNNDIIYFEDEELDSFKNKKENDYNEQEIDEFRDILYTLKPEEIREWINSLEIREINLPEPLKQETLSLLS